MTTRLSVNLNKVALLRNQRDIGYPDVAEHARIVLDSGAHGITVHPRPDERHIRRSDIGALAALVREPAYEEAEFNVEGYPDEDFLALVLSHPVDQVTLVPDSPEARTSDHGWDLEASADMLACVVARLRAGGVRVSLFVDPDPAAPARAKALGADRVELYTGPYAMEWEKGAGTSILPAYARTAAAALEAGLGVNAGHDLNLGNLAAFLAAMPACHEVSIGHAITDDALRLGWPGAVRAYLDAVEESA